MSFIIHWHLVSFPIFHHNGILSDSVLLVLSESLLFSLSDSLLPWCSDSTSLMSSLQILVPHCLSFLILHYCGVLSGSSTLHCPFQFLIHLVFFLIPHYPGVLIPVYSRPFYRFKFLVMCLVWFLFISYILSNSSLFLCLFKFAITPLSFLFSQHICALSTSLLGEGVFWPCNKK